LSACENALKERSDATAAKRAIEFIPKCETSDNKKSKSVKSEKFKKYGTIFSPPSKTNLGLQSQRQQEEVDKVGAVTEAFV